MTEVKYSEEHEWVVVEGNVATIGITDHAQSELGEVVFVELPEVGSVYARGDETGVVESVKAASEIYSPLSGEVVAHNEPLIDTPTLVNDEPEGDGWLFKIEMSDAKELDDLMDEASYHRFIGNGS